MKTINSRLSLLGATALTALALTACGGGGGGSSGNNASTGSGGGNPASGATTSNGAALLAAYTPPADIAADGERGADGAPLPEAGLTAGSATVREPRSGDDR